MLPGTFDPIDMILLLFASLFSIFIIHIYIKQQNKYK
jgi:hypothetical protein